MPNLDNQTVLLAIVAVTALAVLLQAIILLAIFIAVRKAALSLKEEAEDLRSSLMPILSDAQNFFTRLRPKIEATVTDVAAITHGLRAQTAEDPIRGRGSAGTDAPPGQPHRCHVDRHSGLRRSGQRFCDRNGQQADAATLAPAGVSQGDYRVAAQLGIRAPADPFSRRPIFRGQGYVRLTARLTRLAALKRSIPPPTTSSPS